MVLPAGRPTPVPWSEFDGGYEWGRARFLHVRASAYRNRADGYLGEVAVWPTGVVWFQDRDLWFLSTGGTLNGKAVLAEGRKVSLPGVPAEYGRLAYGPDKAFYIQRGAVRSLSADLSRRRVADVSDLVPADVVDPAGRPVEVRATLLGLLSPDDPLLRLRYPQAGTRVDRLYSVVRGPLPLRPDWQYAASPSGRVLLAVGPGSRTLAGYDSSSLQPLWTRTFNENEHPVRLGVPRFTPSGRTAYLGVLGRPREQTIVLDAASGRVRTRLALIDSAFVFEDDRHFIYAAYDGPPNPRFDPGDQFPAPDQVDYSNVLVRCSLRAVCEVAARVPAPHEVPAHRQHLPVPADAVTSGALLCQAAGVQRRVVRACWTRPRVARVAVGAALGCLVLGGCTEQTDPAAGPAAQRSHSNPPESPGPTASVRSSEEATSEACARAQRRAVTNSGLWRAVDAVTSSPTGYSAEAARLVRAELARIEDSLAGRCAGDVPDEAARFVRRARRPAAAAQFGDAQLDEVLKAWLDWSRTAGGERDALGVLRELKACRELLRDLDASYRVWWAWTETGKVWWIELSWDNRTDATLAGSTMGVVAVTRMLEDPFDWAGHPRPSPGRNATLRWGASSADDLAVPPGASKQLVAPDIDQDVHTTATGTLDVRDVSVNLSPPRTDTGCAVPVPERS